MEETNTYRWAEHQFTIHNGALFMLWNGGDERWLVVADEETGDVLLSERTPK